MLETHETLTGEPVGQEQQQITPREREFTVKERTQWQMALRRFMRHRLAVVSVFVFVALILFAFVLPIFWKYKYNGEFIPVDQINQPPSLQHPMGTDSERDMMALVMRGTQQSLKVTFIIALVGTTVGAIWGVFAGFLGAVVDSSLMRIADLILTIPALALAAALANRGGGTVVLIGLVLAAVSAPYVARVVRGVVLSLREREFIEASRALGVQPAHHAAAPAAEYHPGADRERHAADRDRYPRRNRAVLCRCRHPGAGHLARRSGEQVPGRGRRAAVAVLLPRPVHHPDRTLGELHRRRAA
jgi:hypothetical protein